MVLTDYSKYFQGEMAIGQLNHKDVKARMDWYVKVYEPCFLNKLLGSELAQELMYAYRDNPPVPEPSNELKELAEAVMPMLAIYIYFFWENTNTTFNVGIGNVVPATELGSVATPSFRTVKLWNLMVHKNIQFAATIDKTKYPTYDYVAVKYNKAIYSFVNPFDL